MKTQSPFEERLNALTHGIGVVLGIAALILLMLFDTHKTPYSLFSVMVYGFSI
ncbi:MAG: hemolysin III family protein, partial [Flavobacteriales bacterium]|nr:hemolysin III family protein [Flavobacteriales bacterium]